MPFPWASRADWPAIPNNVSIKTWKDRTWKPEISLTTPTGITALGLSAHTTAGYPSTTQSRERVDLTDTFARSGPHLFPNRRRFPATGTSTTPSGACTDTSQEERWYSIFRSQGYPIEWWSETGMHHLTLSGTRSIHLGASEWLGTETRRLGTKVLRVNVHPVLSDERKWGHGSERFVANILSKYTETQTKNLAVSLIDHRPSPGSPYTKLH